MPTTQGHNMELVIAEEAAHHIAQFVREFSDTLPEHNYWIFSVYTVLIPSLLAELRYYGALLPQSRLLGPLWNYLDAGCSIVGGLLQIMDTYNHRPIVNKVKGLFNSLSGTQTIVLTALSYAAFGPAAFAASLAVGLGLSLDETVRYGRRMVNPVYCAKDSLAELNTINRVILPDLEKQIEDLESLNLQEEEASLSRWAWNCKQKRLAQYRLRKEAIEEELTYYVGYRCHKDTESYPDHLKSQRELDVILANSSHCNPDTELFLERLRESRRAIKEGELSPEFDLTPNKKLKLSPTECFFHENERVMKDKIAFKNASINSFIWAVAFTAVLLLCFPAPPVQAAGVALLALASLMYIVKNTPKIASALAEAKEQVLRCLEKNNGDELSRGGSISV